MTREPDDREIDREEDEEFKPLTPEAAQQLAGRMPKLAPWRLLGWQLASGLVLAAAAWMLSGCLLYTSPSPRDKRQSRMPSSA